MPIPPNEGTHPAPSRSLRTILQRGPVAPGGRGDTPLLPANRATVNGRMQWQVSCERRQSVKPLGQFSARLCLTTTHPRPMQRDHLEAGPEYTSSRSSHSDSRVQLHGEPPLYRTERHIRVRHCRRVCLHVCVCSFFQEPLSCWMVGLSYPMPTKEAQRGCHDVHDTAGNFCAVTVTITVPS